MKKINKMLLCGLLSACMVLSGCASKEPDAENTAQEIPDTENTAQEMPDTKEETVEETLQQKESEEVYETREPDPEPYVDVIEEEEEPAPVLEPEPVSEPEPGLKPEPVSKTEHISCPSKGSPQRLRLLFSEMPLIAVS